MGKSFVINEPYSRVQFPDGNSYDAGDTVVLSDANYALLNDGQTRTFDVDDVVNASDPPEDDEAGTADEVILTAPDDSRWRIIVGNDGTLDTEEVLPDALPVNTVAPAITGSANTGQTVTCGTGTWTGSPTPTYTYQWKRDGSNISGETAATYDLVEDDEGASVLCVVTAHNSEGTVSANSNTITPSATADYATTILADNPVAWWRLGAGPDLTDSSVNSHTLTEGGGGVTDAAGLLTGDANGAQTFPFAGDGYLQAADASDIRLGSAFSVEFWVDGGNYAGGLHYISKAGDFRVGQIGGKITFSPLGASSYYADVQTGTLTNGNTYHIVGTWDFATKTSKIYVNGVFVDDLDQSGFGFVATSSGWGALRIGAPVGALPGFGGSTGATSSEVIDEVAIYNYVLDSTKVAAHYAAGTP